MMPQVHTGIAERCCLQDRQRECVGQLYINTEYVETGKGRAGKGEERKEERRTEQNSGPGI